jgi:hypothetical protein
MTRPNPFFGAYLGVESFRARVGIADTTHDADLLAFLNDATRAIERDARRVFFPYIATARYRFPPYAPSATWAQWMDEDLLSVSLIQVAASGQDATPITIPSTDYFLEPNQFGPPYSRIEIDLSSQSALQSGPTPQQAIAVTGQWGSCNATVAAGTETGLSSATATQLTCSNAALIDQGDVLLVDSEAIYVSGRQSAGSTILTVVRGVNGTTAAVHSDGAAVSKYVAPADAVAIVVGDAMISYLENQTYWQSYMALAGTTGAEAVQPHFDSIRHAQRRLEFLEGNARERSWAI